MTRLEEFHRDCTVAAQQRAAAHYDTALRHMLAGAAVWFVMREQRSGAFWAEHARRWMMKAY